MSGQYTPCCRVWDWIDRGRSASQKLARGRVTQMGWKNARHEGQGCHGGLKVHAELGCGVRVPKLVGFMMGLGYKSWVHETGNIWRVAGGQGCHSVVKNPRDFLQHRERERGAG